MRHALLASTALRAQDIPVIPKDQWTEYERYCGADEFYLREAKTFSQRVHPNTVEFDYSVIEQRVLAYHLRAQ